MSENKYYITTPIYYVNDVPHIGHAYTTIAADVLARYQRAQGKDVFFLTGTDEHGAKIAEAANKAGKDPQEFVDELAGKFRNAWEKLNINYSEFIRTTNPSHEKIVQDFIERLQEAGYIEKRKYEGLYCVGCEKYLAKDELVEGKCPDHKTEPTKQSEENYFFLLSKLEKQLEEKIKKVEFKIRPYARENEILGKISTGLKDVSISRENVAWGIPFPGDKSQTIYVWVDALINYYSATKIFKGAPSWPANLHLMAKDILWFHAVIWPAMLIAVGEELPKKVYAHGFFTIGGQKMSKSLGNVIDPIRLAEKYGADAIRYALLREFPFGEDGDISEEKIASRYKNDLGNELGNLVQRTISMINKYEVKVQKPQSISFEKAPHDEWQQFYSSVEDGITNQEFDHILTKIWEMVKSNNAKIETSKPWELAKTNRIELEKVLRCIYEDLFGIAILVSPFMPETAEKMKKQLETLKPEPLFPRIED